MNINQMSVVELKAVLFDMQSQINQIQNNANQVLNVLKIKINAEAKALEVAKNKKLKKKDVKTKEAKK